MNITNSNNLTNEELRENIEQSKYEKRFGCISNSHFRNVIARLPVHGSQLLIYGDFNDIEKSNKKYGFKRTTKFMKKTIKAFSSYLHKFFSNSNGITSVSLGGDEFLFIVDNVYEIDSNSFINSSQEFFKKCKLSMTLGTSILNEADSSFQLKLQEAQQISEENKKNKYRLEYNQHTMPKKFSYTLNRYINATPSKSISKEELKILKEEIEKIFFTSTPQNILSKNSRNDETIMPVTEQVPMLSSNWENNPEELREIFNLQRTNPITSGMRTSTLEEIISSSNPKSYYSTYIDITNLKCSNLLYGHEKTDQNIKNNIMKIIKEEFLNNGIDISSFNYSNFAINLTGCRFMILFSSENPSINPQKIEEILQKVREKFSGNILDISYAVSPKSFELNSFNSFNRMKSRLKKICNEKKAKFRENKNYNSNHSKLWFKKLILQLAEDYEICGYSTFDYEIFKSALDEAFNSIPTTKKAQDTFITSLFNSIIQNNGNQGTNFRNEYRVHTPDNMPTTSHEPPVESSNDTLVKVNNIDAK